MILCAVNCKFFTRTELQLPHRPSKFFPTRSDRPAASKIKALQKFQTDRLQSNSFLHKKLQFSVNKIMYVLLGYSVVFDFLTYSVEIIFGTQYFYRMCKETTRSVICQSQSSAHFFALYIASFFRLQQPNFTMVMNDSFEHIHNTRIVHYSGSSCHFTSIPFLNTHSLYYTHRYIYTQAHIIRERGCYSFCLPIL